MDASFLKDAVAIATLAANTIFNHLHIAWVCRAMRNMLIAWNKLVLQTFMMVYG